MVSGQFALVDIFQLSMFPRSFGKYFFLSPPNDGKTVIKVTIRKSCGIRITRQRKLKSYRRKSMADDRRRTSMEDLPTELTIHILSRLSFNAIINCRLVCKKWLNLVSDSSFVDLHLSRSPTGIIIHHQKPPINMNGRLVFPNNPGALKWVETEDKVGLSSLDLNLAPILQNTDMRLVGSVNGLICLWQYYPNHDNTYICNPVTREYMILPTQCFQRGRFEKVVYGFGVNSLTGEYKVVRAFARNPLRPSVLEAEVYTLGTCQWRSSGPVHVPYRLNAFRNFYGPYLNNHCHWIVRDKQEGEEDTYEIGTFDLDKETFQLFPSSPPVKGNYFRCQISLAILKGCLCELVACYSELTIWVMKEYGIKNSWQKEVVIKREISVDLKWQPHMGVHVIEGLKDGSILMVSRSKLCVFDPRSETDTKIGRYAASHHGRGGDEIDAVIRKQPKKSISSSPRSPDRKFDDAYICNPITREIMILPKQRNYERCYETIVYGFGVSSLTREYKVVRTFQGEIPLEESRSSRAMSAFQAEVYTLGTGQWRSLGRAPCRLDGSYLSYGTFLNDNYHWIVYDEEAPEKICTFDLNKETFQLFPSPPSEVIEESFSYFQNLVVLKGSLCKYDAYHSQLSIWMMKEYGIKKSWHKEMVITEAICDGLEWPLPEPISLIDGFRDGRVLIVSSGNLWVFDPTSDTIEEIEMFDWFDSGLAYRPSFLKLQNFKSERNINRSSMEDLPTVDIFSRLPVKTIICCKLVCKKWRNLVLDSSFVNLHLSRSPTGLIIHKTGYARVQGTLKWVEIEDKVDHHHLHHDHPMSLDLNMLPVYKYSQLYQTGSVNGLICLGQYSLKINHDDAYICNPVTRELLILPRLRLWREGFLEVVYGFGVSSLTGEYKVVRTFQAKVVQNGHKPARPSVMEAEVYTVGTGHWRILGPTPVNYRLNTSQEFYGPFLNSRCHWIVSNNEDAHDKICTFDIDKESFQLLPSPPPPLKANHRFHCRSLAILNGCLCKLDTYDSELTIWVMKEYGIKNSWHKLVVNRTIQWSYRPIHLITENL
ncbi:hypothetical protein OSB04_016311 [Centaurea solstitialis]|uniref:F-box domain-containing protein n=1 Tax=Centaurea solstitialis TaxID=347529 RepID=A0AA38TBS2_9ASTR|nr:hypothetical protein OSB04_016311 [Centaurea solstitialis]